MCPWSYEIPIRRRAEAHRIPIAEGGFCHPLGNQEWIMLDIVFVALGVGWLALCVGYAAICDRL
jgi:hypothetical protein